MLDQEKNAKMQKAEAVISNMLKQWNKPVIMTMTSVELKKHIQAAARSGNCVGLGR